MNFPSLGPGWSAVRPWLLLVFLLVVVNVTVAVAFTLPAWSETAATGMAARRGQQAQDTLEPALDRARRVYGRVLTAEDEIATLSQHVSDRSGTVSDVVTTLRAAIDAAGLDAERVNYSSQPVDELQLVQLQVELPVSGRYEQLRQFLDELLGGPTFAVVERVGATTLSRADTSGRLNMAVTFSAFAAAETFSQGEGAEAAEGAALTRAAGDPVQVAQGLSQRLAALPQIPLQPEQFELNLARLDDPMPVGEPSRRNLFAFAGAAARPAPVDSIDDGPPVDALPPEPPRPVMPYSLLGITKTIDGYLATLSKDDELHVVGSGAVLPDGMRVVRVEEELVIVEAGDRRTRIRLGKNQPNDPLKDRER
jgi:Tfp pilus assembly protein PilO